MSTLRNWSNTWHPKAKVNDSLRCLDDLHGNLVGGVLSLGLRRLSEHVWSLHVTVFETFSVWVWGRITIDLHGITSWIEDQSLHDYTQLLYSTAGQFLAPSR